MRVVIVGTGIVGLAIAEELSRQGIAVELFEQGQEAGRQASWAAAGILSPYTEVKEPGPFFDLLLTAYQFFPETVIRLESLTGISLKYRASGLLGLAFSDEDERELMAQMAWHERMGLRVERLDSSRLTSVEPAVDGPVRLCLWWPQAAHIDNRKLVEAYLQLIQKQGAAVHLNSSVRKFVIERGKVIGVETAQGITTADWIVDAMGSWENSLLPFSVPVTPVKGQILQLRTNQELVHAVVKSPRGYLVQRDQEKLIAGTTLERAGFDTQVTEEARTGILANAQQICSQVASLLVEATWAGLRPGTPDGLPILGTTPLGQLILATGHYRNGILLAPLTGRLMTELILRGKCSIDLEPFQISRFLSAG